MKKLLVGITLITSTGLMAQITAPQPSPAAKFEQIRSSYKGAFSDMKQEQESHVRGGQGLAYDQL